jgi:orotidine-5'-phosphate decarboxylase
VTGSRVIVALDYSHESDLQAFAARVAPADCRLKIGLEAYTALGPRAVEALVARGFDVFLDLKFHDIPNTVRAACRAAAGLGAWMINVHVAGGARMLAAAREGVSAAAKPPLLIGVTVLTSQSAEDLAGTGVALTPAEAVMKYARLARAAGLDGVVCSGEEAASVRRECGPDFVIVTPGIRPAGTGAGDQRRTMTPAEAIEGGADYLVIGRPITQAPDPRVALDAIRREIVELPNARRRR